MKMKRKAAIVFWMIICMFSFSGCESFLQTSVRTKDISRIGVEQAGTIGKVDITNYDSDITMTEAIEINLDELAESAEEVYTYSNQCLTIHEPGEYVLSGRLASGNLVVDVYDDEVVHLFLHNAEINSGKKPAIMVEKADKVIITVVEGTENTLSDAPRHREEQEACVFSNADLTINGNGVLHIYGYHADGIHVKDQLKILGTNLTVHAKADGVKGNDGVILYDSMADVECEGSGIASKSDKDMVVMQGGSCKIIAGEYAVTSNKYVSIDNCRVDFYSVLETVRCNGIRNYDEELIK